MNIFNWKRHSKVKKIITGSIALRDNIPVNQVEMDKVNRLFDGLGEEGRKGIEKEINQNGEKETIKRYGSFLRAHDITRRVVSLAFARYANIPVEQIDERKVHEVLLTLDEKTIYEFATISMESGEERAIAEFLQVIGQNNSPA